MKNKTTQGLGNKNLLSFPTAGKFVAHAPDFH
jgi:hypothetical protein